MPRDDQGALFDSSRYEGAREGVEPEDAGRWQFILSAFFAIIVISAIAIMAKDLNDPINLFLLISLIAVAAYSIGQIREAVLLRAGGLSVRITTRGIELRAGRRRGKRTESIFLPIDRIATLVFIVDKRSPIPGAFIVKTKDGRNYYSGTRLLEEMEALHAVARSTWPEICSIRQVRNVKRAI